MATSRLEDRSDADLVAIFNDTQATESDRTSAFRVLDGRHRGMLLGWWWKHAWDHQRLLAIVGCRRPEDFFADAWAKAVDSFDPGCGAKFSTHLIRVLNSRIRDAGRKLKRSIKTGRLTEAEEGLPAPGLPPDDLALLRDDLALLRENVRACGRVQGERAYSMLCLSFVEGLSAAQIRDLYPALSAVAIRQAVHRAKQDFVLEWERRGGQRVEQLVELVGEAMASEVDPGRIKDPTRRNVYLKWVEKRRDLAETSRTLGIDVDALRGILLDALEEMFSKVMRGGRIEAEALRGHEDDLTDLLQLAEDTGRSNPVVERVNRILQFVRVALGLAAPETVVHTLGSLLQDKLSTPADYERTMKALALNRTQMRRLLAGHLTPDEKLYGRLSEFLDVPEPRLRLLTRPRSVEPSRPLRSQSFFDERLYEQRVREWLTK